MSIARFPYAKVKHESPAQASVMLRLLGILFVLLLIAGAALYLYGDNLAPPQRQIEFEVAPTDR